MRADRAVKVSKKELNELISELMEYMEPSDDENDADASALYTTIQHDDSIAAPSTPNVAVVSNPQISPKVLQVISQSPKQSQVQFLVPALPPPRVSAPAASSSPIEKVFKLFCYNVRTYYILIVEHIITHKYFTLNQVPVVVPQPANTPVIVQTEFNQEIPVFTRDQRLLLNQQMMQHTQLLTQNYMQSTLFPEFHTCAAEMREDLVSFPLLV
jgi:hypothetical protein